MFSSLLDIARKAFIPKSPQQQLRELTRSPEDVLQSLGYDPQVLKCQKFKTKDLRVVETSSSLTEEQKKAILGSVFPRLSSSYSSNMLARMVQARADFWVAMHSRYNAAAWPKKRLIMLSTDPDMTYRGMISAHTSIPEDELEISEKETEIPRIQAFSLLHELAHFEAEGDPVNHTSRTLLSAEIYCDSRALDGLAIQKDFNNDHFYRNWILMRAVQDTNNSIQRAVKNHIKCRAASSSGGMGCRPDFSHSTALFLKNPDHTASCEEVIQEYNSLLLALYSTIRCEWGLSIEDRISKTYKAACLLLERGGSDNLILSPLQREILELYTEGMEHFCPTKCQCWRGELESKTIPVSSDQVYDRALEAGL